MWKYHASCSDVKVEVQRNIIARGAIYDSRSLKGSLWPNISQNHTISMSQYAAAMHFILCLINQNQVISHIPYAVAFARILVSSSSIIARVCGAHASTSALVLLPSRA